jgi:hypothetical protein
MTRLLQPLVAIGLACSLSIGAPHKSPAAEKSSPVALLREALHAESLGVPQLRAEATATSAAPLAQAYAGNIRQGNAWLSVDDAIARQNQDSRMKQYQALRDKTRDMAQDHLRLADWCGKKGLTQLEQAHLLRSLDFQPDNEAVRKRLGHVRGEREWISREQAALEQAVAAAKEQWLPKLRTAQALLQSGSTSERQQAREELLQIRDPLAVPALEDVLSTNESNSLLLLEILARIDDPLAAQAEVRLAVESEASSVRAAAIALLGQLDPYAYVPLLLSRLKADIVTSVALVPVLRGAHYSQRITRANLDHDENLIVDINIYRVGGNRAANAALSVALQQRVLEENNKLEREVSDENLKTAARNERIVAALKTATGEDHGRAPQGWWDWWRRESEIQEQRQRAQVTMQRTSAVAMSDANPWADPQEIPTSFRESSQFQSERLIQRCECFVAGTPVWTTRGKLAIEQIRTGELVLTQNMQSGQLEFKPVIRPTTRPAMALVNLTIGQDEFTCTGGHLFWVVEQGWVKARDLKPGTMVHGVQGSALVVANEAGPTSPTFNLVMADNHNYFVGQSRLLTHDNTPRQAMAALIAPGVAVDEE